MSIFCDAHTVNQPLVTLDQHAITLKREDRLHPTVSGNKFRKLKYNLLQAQAAGHNTLLTFGGPYSNHLAATAAAGKIMGFKSIGVVRGEEPRKPNPTLRFCQSQGMKLFPISRAAYKNKERPDFVRHLHDLWGSFYLIPEGGNNALARKGCEEILSEDERDFDVIACAVGTGGTLAGLIQSALPHQTVVGFAALKNQNIEQDIRQWTNKNRWIVNCDYTFGGYAKVTPPLIDFINTFNKNFKTPLDPIYTGKLLFGIFDMIKNKQWVWGKKILVLHTGGLQGIAGMNEKLEQKGWTKIAT